MSTISPPGMVSGEGQEPPDTAPDTGGATRTAASGGVTCACSPEELLRLPLFEGESRESVEWIASLMTLRSFEPGEILSQPGDPVNEFQVVLEGEIHYGRPDDPASPVMIAHEGQAIGVLPFSRLKTALGRAQAVRFTRLAGMDAAHLRELVYRAPVLAQRLVSQMTDRTRETARTVENSNRLLALGKLAAGLAHELNNPAAAAVRSSSRLRELINLRRQRAIAFPAEQIPAAAAALAMRLSDSVTECHSPPGTLDELERNDRESELSDWLEEKGLPGWLASGLTDAGITSGQIAPLAELLSVRALSLALETLVDDHEILCLTRELEETSHRISDLILSIKTYSYMDQSPVAEVDVEQGIELTLRMFQHRTRSGVQVSRRYAEGLPRIRANGSALNQIWTNLIDNSLDAIESMPKDQPRVLSVRTCQEPSAILVEIGDNGPGIPADVQARIFDPFFTTKPVGEGTGLGLDIVQRIVRNHKGSIRVNSQPGKTVFQVRLPI